MDPFGGFGDIFDTFFGGGGRTANQPRSGEDIARTIDTSFLSQLVLDMRFSAQTATLGNISLTDVAAAARIEGGRATFDVGDATAYGGSVLGRVTLAESGIEGGG